MRRGAPHPHPPGRQVRFIRDMRQHLQRDAHTDWREMLRFAWLSVFWAGFVLW